VDRAALRVVATQAANELEIGRGKPVSAPFLMKVSDCVRVSSTDLVFATRKDGTLFTRFTLCFGKGDEFETSNPLLIPDGNFPQVIVTADSGATPDDKPGAVMSEVDGHPAHDGTSVLVVYGVDGFAFEISGSRGSESGPPAALSQDAAVAVFRSVSVYSGAKQSQSAWGAPIVS
jgi:hypothetical protein